MNFEWTPRPDKPDVLDTTMVLSLRIGEIVIRHQYSLFVFKDDDLWQAVFYADNPHNPPGKAIVDACMTVAGDTPDAAATNLINQLTPMLIDHAAVYKDYNTR